MEGRTRDPQSKKRKRRSIPEGIIPKTQKKPRVVKQEKGDGNEGRIPREDLDETTHVVQGGLRCIVPYPYTFKVFAKERWIGKKLLEVLLEEFKANDEAYYNKAIQYGLVYIEQGVQGQGKNNKLQKAKRGGTSSINKEQTTEITAPYIDAPQSDKSVDSGTPSVGESTAVTNDTDQTPIEPMLTIESGNPNYLFQHSDRLVHVMHRHEPPVTSRPIVIVHDDEKLLVIDKPSSIPVHPSGRFRHNSVIFILSKEFGYSELHCTSFLLCFMFFLLSLFHSGTQNRQIDIRDVVDGKDKRSCTRNL
eukprot:TRINITY_DN4190_c0_g1_i2.p1 TRINITY_DN4190_c0_g1~~TRINITY_DN4190_c0_g1_i2.p1  ORF type:complete len:305 (-),score=53.26 TRINITY_DN4190_c0_g1_i2:399-1313(-)